eukprot:scaffold105380_cov74-Phaeocystis_antarctica.AAC.10
MWSDLHSSGSCGAATISGTFTSWPSARARSMTSRVSGRHSSRSSSFARAARSALAARLLSAVESNSKSGTGLGIACRMGSTSAATALQILASRAAAPLLFAHFNSVQFAMLHSRSAMYCCWS